MGLPLVQPTRGGVTGEDDTARNPTVARSGAVHLPVLGGIAPARRGATAEDYGIWLLRQSRAVRTIKSYGRSLERFSTWLKRERRGGIRSVGWKDVRDYGETLPYTYASRSAFVSALRSYWKYLGRPDCPAWAVRCPKAPRRVGKPLSREELDRVLAAAEMFGPKVIALCACAYYLGLRREDLATLRWAQFRRDGSLHVVGKGGVERSIPVVAAVVNALEELPRAGEYLFPGRWGGHISPGTVSLWVTKVSDVSGVNLWPHRFRHTTATNGYQATKDLFAVQQFLGHAKPSTTRGYVLVAWADVQAVGEAL